MEGYFLQKRLIWVYFKGYYEVIEVVWLKIHYQSFLLSEIIFPYGIPGFFKNIFMVLGDWDDFNEFDLDTDNDNDMHEVVAATLRECDVTHRM